MNRLSAPDREQVMKRITYSTEDRAKIDAVKSLNWFGRLIDVDPFYFSTMDGITKQLDKFVLPMGLLYYIDKDLQLQRIAVSITFERNQ